MFHSVNEHFQEIMANQRLILSGFGGVYQVNETITLSTAD